MTLQARLAELITAIGADIKAIKSSATQATPYYLAQTDTFSVAQYKQVVFGTTIDNEGFLDVEGILEEV